MRALSKPLLPVSYMRVEFHDSLGKMNNHLIDRLSKFLVNEDKFPTSLRKGHKGKLFKSLELYMRITKKRSSSNTSLRSTIPCDMIPDGLEIDLELMHALVVFFGQDILSSKGRSLFRGNRHIIPSFPAKFVFRKRARSESNINHRKSEVEFNAVSLLARQLRWREILDSSSDSDAGDEYFMEVERRRTLSSKNSLKPTKPRAQLENSGRISLREVLAKTTTVASDLGKQEARDLPSKVLSGEIQAVANMKKLLNSQQEAVTTNFPEEQRARFDLDWDIRKSNVIGPVNDSEPKKSTV